MNSTDLLVAYRSQMSDAVAPYLWSDEEIFEYANDAQSMFCRKTDGIADSQTTAVVNLPVAVNDEWLDLHPSILRVLTAHRDDDGREIEVVNRTDLRSRGWRFDGSTNRVRALIIGMHPKKARVYPKSSEAVGLSLSVFRLPLVPITSDGDQPLEIDDEHHPHLLLWMRHRGYLKHDSETFDQGKADDFEARFLRYCDMVKREERRKAFKVRTVAYGGL